MPVYKYYRTIILLVTKEPLSKKKKITLHTNLINNSIIYFSNNFLGICGLELILESLLPMFWLSEGSR